MHVALLKSRIDHTGGLEKYTLRLAEAFHHAGCRVTILTTGKATQLDFARVISLGPTSKFSFWHLSQFNKKCEAFLQNQNFHLVFGMERTSFQTHYRAGSGVHAAYLKRRAETSSLLKRLSFKVNPLHRLLLSLEKKAFENPSLNLLFTNSQMVKKEILTHYQIPESKLSVVHNGVEWHKYEEAFKKSICQKREGPFHFLFVGQGFRRKGLLLLIKGLESLETRDFILTVVGKDKEYSFFKREVFKRGLASNIRFAGHQKDMLPYYQAADSLVLPSYYDPFANVTVEALAMGLFVVTSTHNGGSEVLTEESGCVIENLSSQESMKASLQKAMLHPKTPETATLIRSSIKDLDFSNQLDKIVRQSCASVCDI